MATDNEEHASKAKRDRHGTLGQRLPPLISLGDLVSVLKKLDPSDDKTRATMAAALGFRFVEPVAARTEPAEEKRPEPVKEVVSAMPTPRKADTPPATKTPDVEWHPSTIGTYSLKSVPESFKVSPLAPASSKKPELPFEPLLVPNWTRAILSSALSTNSDSGPLDVEKLVETISREEAVEHLPRRPWPTLRLGVSVLVDVSEAMTLFSRDQERMVDDIMRVVGPEKVSVSYFAGHPGLDMQQFTGRSMVVAPDESIPAGPAEGGYVPPPSGSPVLMLTDLGIGWPLFSTERASPSDWYRFAVSVIKAGSPLLALVPYRAERWPQVLTRVISIIQWDRSTTVATVLRALETVPKNRR